MEIVQVLVCAFVISLVAHVCKHTSKHREVAVCRSQSWITSFVARLAFVVLV